MIFRGILAQWSSLLFSLFLALFAWAVATNEENPSREALFPEPLAIEYTNRADGLVLYQKSADTVHVRVRAPEAVWKTLRADNFQAVVNLNKVGSGSQQANVSMNSVDPQVTIIAVEPPAVTVRLEAIKQIALEPRVRIIDEAPVGYEYKTPSASPSKVTVSGPEVLIRQVNDVTADMALRGAKAPVDREVSLSVHDAQGNAIQNLTITPSTVQVHVPVEQRVGYKDVAVKAVVKGNVTSGYWVSDISVDPPTVTLIGAPEALNKIPGFVEAQSVSVTGAREDITKRVGLNLPAGISALNVGDVSVRVAVEPVLGGITIRRAITVIKLSCDLQMTVSPDSVDVILSGPLPILQTLAADDVQMVADVTGCVPASQQIAPRAVNIPESIRVERIVPSTVEINAKHE